MVRTHDDWIQSPQGALTNCLMACFTFYINFAKYSTVNRDRALKAILRRQEGIMTMPGLTAKVSEGQPLTYLQPLQNLEAQKQSSVPGTQ